MRRDDWQNALSETVRRHQQLPFAWGTSDCLLFPLDCVRAMTGQDFSELHGEYASQAQAYRRLRSFGFANVADAFAAHFPEISPAMMGTGDLAVVDDDGAICGAICLGRMTAGKTQDGLLFIGRSLVQRAFKVG